ncbi:MAG: 3-hydroxyacyl-CoA dehydrogenase family protein, partial [Dehalococcoidia bacterium]|nr:3-hydroxyacyl-CoA dehydrogenase family protein [Dehalococcoidia bacterium]
MEIKKIGVVGAGLMGSGIAQVCAQAGFQVAMRDTEERFLQTGAEAIKKSLQRFAKAGKIKPEEVDGIAGRIRGTVDLGEAVQDADLVIEAVPEEMELKKKVFAELDGLCPAQAILASNTSALMITDIASATKRPEQVIGMHWFNPPPMMKLIEVVRGAVTADETIQAVTEFSIKVGKEPVVVNDGPGFFTTRYTILQQVDAIKFLESGVASIPDMDKMVKLGFGWPMGVFEIMDFVGLDTMLHILDYLYRE